MMISKYNNILFDISVAEKPFDDFNYRFSSVVNEVKPDIVVAIARGAIRLLQLQNVLELLTKIPLISDYALPYLSVIEIKSKRLLLYDDSVIFGSTMDKFRNYLINRGTKVYCASYVIDRHSFL